MLWGREGGRESGIILDFGNFSLNLVILGGWFGNYLSKNLVTLKLLVRSLCKNEALPYTRTNAQLVTNLQQTFSKCAATTC